MPKVSVIVPIYKVENYIEECARSLFSQTLSDIEFVFIDDCSPDQSINILYQVLEEFPKRVPQVKIFRNEVNKGIATTRNIGLKAATGEYIIHCDSDDWVDANMYEELYTNAKQGDHEIVWCDYYLVKEGKPLYRKQECPTKPAEVIKSLLQVLPPHAFNWNKLVKRDLYFRNNIEFPAGINVQEDFIVTVKHFYFSKSVAYVPKPLYFYRYRKSSVTREKFEELQVKDRIYAIKVIEEFFKEHNHYDYFKREINIKKLKFKLRILQNSRRKKKWISVYPEANENIKDIKKGILITLALYAASYNSVIVYEAIIKFKEKISKLKILG